MLFLTVSGLVCPQAGPHLFPSKDDGSLMTPRRSPVTRPRCFFRNLCPGRTPAALPATKVHSSLLQSQGPREPPDSVLQAGGPRVLSSPSLGLSQRNDVPGTVSFIHHGPPLGASGWGFFTKNDFMPLGLCIEHGRLSLLSSGCFAPSD